MLPVIFLMGPTASGKTALAVDLVQTLNCEVISVDSALIYKGMDIGTAKPNAQMQAIAPHHLIDLIDPAQSYSVGEFCRDAKALIADIHNRGKIPLLVGGTMMYYQALLNGVADMPKADDELRAKLQARYEQEGAEALHEELKAIDPSAAERIHANNHQRLLRALEIYQLSGKSQTWWWQQQENTKLKYPVLQVAMVPSDRKWLHERIALRYQIMMEQGFEQEARELYERGDLHVDMPSIRCVGYRQMWGYLQGEYSLDEAIEKGVVATRQLAKRQLTWLRSWENLVEFDPQQPNINEYAREFISTWLADKKF